MASYMSVDREEIQKAFALAHKCADNPDIGDRERKYFRAIAFLIWQACGEQEHMPAKLPKSFPGTDMEVA